MNCTTPVRATALLALTLFLACSPVDHEFGSAGGGGGAGSGGGSATTTSSGGAACGSPADCPAGDHASATCDGGVCGLACDRGFIDCDPARPGCETSATARESCGACGNACATVCIAPADAPFCNDPIEITAGYAHTCVLRKDGSVWCWGRNTYGEAGPSMEVTAPRPPSPVPLPRKAIQVAAGGGFALSSGGDPPPAHTCALLDDSKVFCWGNGVRGQLGNGSFTDRSPPVQVMGLVNIVQLSLGAAHACAVKTGNELFCWGSNRTGQVGAGMTTDTVLSPTFIEGDVRQVGAGQDHTCAVRASDGGLLCWGKNFDGQLGNGSTDTVLSPGPVARPLDRGVDEVASGDRHTCARKGAEVYCFGNNYNGAVGAGIIGPVTEPALVSVLNVRQIDVGRERSGAVSGDAGRVVMWGIPSLGDGSEGGVVPGPVEAMLTGVAQIAAGYEHTCALTTSGEVFCWGEDRDGQLAGAAGGQSARVPVPVRLDP